MRLVDNSYNIFIKTGGEGGEIENKSMVINDIFGQSIRKEEIKILNDHTFPSIYLKKAVRISSSIVK